MNGNETEVQYFKDAILFFKEVQWLYNMPVTRILFDGSLNLFPIDWLEILKKLNNNELNRFVANAEVQTHWPASLIDFVKNCEKFNKLPNPTISLSSIQLPEAFLKKLSVKKQHEIFQLSQLIHQQCQLQNISLIVDLGAGLGYISQLLNHLYGYQVLGLESKLQNVKKVKIRQKMLFPNSLSSVKYVFSNVTVDSSKSIKSILQQEFKNTENVCLIGLHACGDLSACISKIFLDMKIAQLLILVSCCYHKLTLVNTVRKVENKNGKEYFNYFPLSTSLKIAFDIVNIDIGVFFRRPFMRLACQETSDRWFSMLEEVHNDHSFYVLARAVLELYAAENKLHLKKLVRKATRKSQCSDFESYLEDCMRRYIYEKETTCEKLSMNIVPWNDKIKAKIINLWKNNTNKLKNVELYTALQLLLQCAAESLVQFDRLCYLKEQNFEAEIIPIMNRSLSPRCYALVSKKQ